MLLEVTIDGGEAPILRRSFFRGSTKLQTTNHKEIPNQKEQILKRFSSISLLERLLQVPTTKHQITRKFQIKKE
jgi:hypothetical protein